MKLRFSIRFRRSGAAFSLVEVSLAVAVLAIGLLAVIGLFPQGLKAARDAADNTLSATIVQDLFAQLRSSNFDSIQICTNPLLPSDPKYPCDSSVPGTLLCFSLSGLTPSCSSPSVSPLTLYFDQDGFILPNPTPPGPPASAYYKVTLAWTPQGSVPADFATVSATIAWPAKSSAPINMSIFVEAIARYQ